MNIEEIAKECGFQDDMETVGFISCDYAQLEAYTQAVINAYVREQAVELNQRLSAFDKATAPKPFDLDIRYKELNK